MVYPDEEVAQEGKGIIVSANPDSQYYGLRPRRLTVLLKYEDADDYDWENKDFDSGYQIDDNGNFLLLQGLLRQ